MTVNAENVAQHHQMQQSGSLLADYVSLAVFCREFGVSRRTVDRWNELGTGPDRTLIGRKIYISRDAIRRWLESREQRKDRRGRKRVRKGSQ